MLSAARRVASKLKTDPSSLAGKGAVLRTGVIVSYSSGRATVTVGGDPTEIPNCPCVAGTFAPGDVVQVVQEPPRVPTVLCILT